ncbi:MAG: LytTR family transcriptional regulator [Lachnospiraceae bacterium]|nr:LytTR family transcriptional regulator [Lachnospiraceae bacterium]
MVIKLEQDLSCTDIEVIIKYGKDRENLPRIVKLLKSIDIQIKCDNNGTERMVNASDIYYIESVDKQTFVYLEREVYHTDFRLYQLIEQLKKYGFVQISKSCILNIHYMDSIKSIFNSRMEATLKNSERVYINRNYLDEVKKVLRGETSI